MENTNTKENTLQTIDGVGLTETQTEYDKVANCANCGTYNGLVGSLCDNCREEAN